MTNEEISGMVAKQRAFYNSRAILDVGCRIEMLKKLRRYLAENTYQPANMRVVRL